eukprot:gene2635-biopygen4211
MKVRGTPTPQARRGKIRNPHSKSVPSDRTCNRYRARNSPSNSSTNSHSNGGHPMSMDPRSRTRQLMHLPGDAQTIRIPWRPPAPQVKPCPRSSAAQHRQRARRRWQPRRTFAKCLTLSSVIWTMDASLAIAGRSPVPWPPCKKRLPESARFDAIAEFPDPQIALLLLRHCASYGKVVHSMRVTPHDFHEDALGEFDARVRECFEGFTGLHPDDEQWRQATLGTRFAGLGLRSAADHAAAAFLASRSASHSLCRDIDPAFVWDVAQAGAASEATVAFSGAGQDYSGAWLHAVPNPNFGNQVAPSFFRVMLQRRLRIPIYDGSFHCSFCASVMDAYGDHALACSGGGDRTIRHNILRNIAFRLCHAAGLRPEIEKPGLLRPRPLIGSSEEDGKSQPGGRRGPDGRRPADVYLPSWRLGRPACLDFAVTSGLEIGSF